MKTVRGVAGIDEFVRDPCGRWVVAAPTILVFCASPALVGTIAWGAPSAEDVRRMLAAYDGYRHPAVAPRFDLVQDGRAIERIDPDAMALLLGWLAERRGELASRVQHQYGVVDDSLIGVTLSGIWPVLGGAYQFQVVRSLRDALCAIAPDGETLAAELEAATAAARGESIELHRLRGLLRDGRFDARIDDLARELAVSVRTLQRVLADAGTSFRGEARHARFAAAHALLIGGVDKLAVVARRVGLSENGLTKLVRDETGLTPAELRRRGHGRVQSE